MARTALQKWRSWTLPTKLSLIIGLLALILATVEIAPQIKAGLEAIKIAWSGPPPMDAPLEEQVGKARIELADNIDCLQSYRILYQRENEFPLCRPKLKFIRSLYSQFSAVSSRDRFDESNEIYKSLGLLLNSYDGIESVSGKSSFLYFEKKSPLLLRDMLFLTVFQKYYWDKFDVGDSSCFDDSGRTSERCQKIFEKNEPDNSQYDDLTLQWDDLPARYILIDDQIAKTVGDWHSHVDGVVTFEMRVSPENLRGMQKDGTSGQFLGTDGKYLDYNTSRKNVIHVILDSGDGGALKFR